MNKVDVIIVGASASGLMCASQAGRRGRKVLVLDHANKPGKKILMSGGGRCNFTNYDVSASNYISTNPHFCKSALSRFTQWDFIAMVEQYCIPYHERDHGQLFCNDSAKDILNMLLEECEKSQVEIRLKHTFESVEKKDGEGFVVYTDRGKFECESLVIASGGLSIPKMCASPIGYKVAEHFGLAVLPTRAGLVPFTLHDQDKQRFSALSGIAVDSAVQCGSVSFRENLLFTHRGLSGPVILQISSYWHAGEELQINFLPDVDLTTELKNQKQRHPQQQLKTILNARLPKRLTSVLFDDVTTSSVMQQLSDKKLETIAGQIQAFTIKPNGTEGYRTAEVTLGGIDCNELSSKTMESKKVPGLYFIGEVIDVTGWLGGYNFQWAWSSGWCAGQVV